MFSKKQYHVNKNPSMKQQQEQQTPASPRESLILQIYLPFLVFLDVMSVTLVIPLLHQYYKDAGMIHTTQREMLNSIYSSCQIVGGLTLGALNDSGILTPWTTLINLSFLGSSISYFLLALSIQTTHHDVVLRNQQSSSLYLLISSRIVVGFVKQTITMTTAIVSQYTTTENRSKYLGRLSVARTLASIVGPSLGAFLYHTIGRSIPVWIASLIFLINFFLAKILLSKHITASSSSYDITIASKHMNTSLKEVREETYPSTTESKNTITNMRYTWRRKVSSLVQNVYTTFQSKSLKSVLLSSLLYTFISSATSYANMTSYYEDMYGIQPYQRGYLSSYQSIWTLFIQTFFVHPLLKKLGGEAIATCIAAGVLTLITLAEIKSNLTLFLLGICPILAFCTSILSLSIRTLVTQVTPKSSFSSVLATLDVLTNAVAVLVPFYRAMLFRFMGCFPRMVENSNTCLKGDPTPFMWLVSSGVHWMFTTITLYFLLIHNQYRNLKEE